MWIQIWKGSTGLWFGLSKSFSIILLWNPYLNYNHREAQRLQQDLLLSFWASEQIPKVLVRHTAEPRTCWWRSQGCEEGGEKNILFQTSPLTFLLQKKCKEAELDISKHVMWNKRYVKQRGFHKSFDLWRKISIVQKETNFSAMRTELSFARPKLRGQVCSLRNEGQERQILLAKGGKILHITTLHWSPLSAATHPGLWRRQTATLSPPITVCKQQVLGGHRIAEVEDSRAWRFEQSNETFRSLSLTNYHEYQKETTISSQIHPSISWGI